MKISGKGGVEASSSYPEQGMGMGKGDEKLKHPGWSRDVAPGVQGMSERTRLPPFYSGADLHNDQRLSCLSKLFSAICIIFCRAIEERRE